MKTHNVERVVGCLERASEMLFNALSYGKSDTIDKIIDLLSVEIDSHTDELDALSVEGCGPQDLGLDD